MTEVQQQSRVYTGPRPNCAVRVPTHHFPLKHTQSTGVQQNKDGLAFFNPHYRHSCSCALTLICVQYSQCPCLASSTLHHNNGSSAFTNERTDADLNFSLKQQYENTHQQDGCNKAEDCRTSTAVLWSLQRLGWIAPFLMWLTSGCSVHRADRTAAYGKSKGGLLRTLWGSTAPRTWNIWL